MSIGQFYSNHLKRKLFNKILVIYLSITVVTLIAAAFAVYKYYEQAATRDHINANKEVLDYMSMYMNQQYEGMQLAVQQIYSDASLSQDVATFLSRDYETYLKYRLDHYAESGSFVPRTFETFFKSYMDQHAGVKNILLSSFEQNFILIKSRTRMFYTNVTSPYDPHGIFDNASRNQWLSRDNNAFLWDERREDKDIFTISRELRDPISLKGIGMLMVDFDTEGITNWIASRRDSRSGQHLALKPNGEVLYDSLGQYTGQYYPHISKLNSDNWTMLDEPSRVNLNAANSSGLILVGITPKSEIDKELSLVRDWIFVITLTLIIAATLITYGFILRFSKEIKVILHAMKRLQEGDLTTRIVLHREDELQLIANNFNYMCERLEQYIEKVYISEIMQKKADLVAFQAQINPHFLYNTLEVIRMRAISQGARDVGQMTYILSTLFRNIVKKKMIVTLEDEIEYCQLYLELFQIRHDDKLQVETVLSKPSMNCMIVKLLIQPVIENYIVHGFEPDRSDNLIRIEVSESDGQIYITIRDNGVGIAPEKLEELRQMLHVNESIEEMPSSIGIYNVNARIKKYYGTTYGMTIDSEVGIGTTVQITIPAIRGQ
ncbi:sensor histidine kinase [Paenibacillus sp. N1-5-1-14]|uniref:sensor histidine kinase n=1 Tax=Paenibacillus radicibacter TaxID=2972488 RepID=UPI0021593031|nr:sensor histidine kinase [Paenibacillus radicibacter]MCR8642522.1 sensor histidine kinase [Paenibacillus radicibacter]